MTARHPDTEANICCIPVYIMKKVISEYSQYLSLKVEPGKTKKKRKKKKEKAKDFDQDFQFSDSDDEGHVNGWNLQETVEHLRKEAVVGLCKR